MTLKTRAELQSEYAANIADNSSGDISPQDVREALVNTSDSFLPAGVNSTNAAEVASVLAQLGSVPRETLLAALLPDDADDCLTLLSTLADRMGVTFVVVPDIDPEDPSPPPVLAAGQLIETVAEMATGVWSAEPTVPDELDVEAHQFFPSDDTGEVVAVTVAASRFLGRKSSGNIGAMTAAEAITELGDLTGSVTAASTSAAGKVELATDAETTTGTDATRAITPDGLAGSQFGKVVRITCPFGTGVTASTGDGKFGFVVPAALDGFNLIACADGAILGTAGTTNAMTFMVRRVRSATPADMLSAAISFASGAVVSTGGTINTSNDDVTTGDFIFIDCDSVSTTPAVGKIEIPLTFQKP